MNFSDWLEDSAQRDPKLTELISTLKPYFTESVFNYDEFEKSVSLSLENEKRKIEQAIIRGIDAEGQED
jgi:hypothetical protein